MRLSTNQSKLLEAVKNNPGLNTHQLAERLGHKQAYERYLKDRLFNLKFRGLLTADETLGTVGQVIERRWNVR